MIMEIQSLSFELLDMTRRVFGQCVQVFVGSFFSRENKKVPSRKFELTQGGFGMTSFHPALRTFFNSTEETVFHVFN